MLKQDVLRLSDSFKKGKRVGLIVTSERTDTYYTTDFIATMFEKESGGLLSVRRSILGNMQQGGRPSPFDRIQADAVGGTRAAISRRAGLSRRAGGRLYRPHRGQNSIHLHRQSARPHAVRRPASQRTDLARERKNRRDHGRTAYPVKIKIAQSERYTLKTRVLCPRVP